MYHTPPRTMVKTRSLLRKEREQMDKEEQSGKPQDEEFPPNAELRGKSDEMFPINRTICINAGSLIKSEPPLKTVTLLPTAPHHQSEKAKSKKSMSSSALARKAKLELEAAEAKAKIQMELIDKKLAAELADIDVESSLQSDRNTHSEVEKWLERSHQELDAPPAPDHGLPTGAPCLPTSNNAGTDDGTVRLLASALKDLTTASANNGPNSSLLSRICTPRDLPTFTGDPMEWLQFKQTYDESSQVCNFSSKENLWRLRKCLSGQAREAVSALLISATSPELVMSTLELQFGNPDVILSRIMMDIKKLHPVSQEYHKDIVAFSVKVRNYVAAVSVIGRDEYLVATSVITCVLSKLPTVLLSKWADYSYPLITQGKRPTLHTLAEFLNEEAVKTNSLALLYTHSALDHSSNHNRRRYQEPTSNRSHALLFNGKDDVDNKCNYCHITNHKLTDCKKFLKSLRRDRWTYVKRNRLCYKCLLSKHGRDTCPAVVCDVDNCGLAHHRLLHYTYSANKKVGSHERDEDNRRVSSQLQVLEGQPQPEYVESPG